MELHIVSDLHFEFGEHPVEPVGDVVVAAGDLGAGNSALDCVDDWLAAGVEVVMVLGNHEFYHDDIDAVLANWRAIASERRHLHLLSRDAVVLGDVRFLGATLWTDFDGCDRRAMATASLYMADFSVVSYSGRRLEPRDTTAFHARDVAWLGSALAQPHDGPTVVVTHHLPHPGSIAAHFSGSELNPAFVSDLSELIVAGRPALWVHGHTHTACDYQVHDTRIVCNPRGYPGEERTAFSAGKTITIAEGVACRAPPRDRWRTPSKQRE